MRDPVAVHRAMSRAAPWCALFVFAVLMPGLYGVGAVDISTLNTWGKFLAIAIMAIGVDLVWGYAGMLSLCQMLFFTLGGYGMGMYLAMHGPLDGDGIPRCLYVVSSNVSGTTLPWFWQPFASFTASAALVLLLPALVAGVFGWFAFRSRVKGVYFSIITQAFTIAVWLVCSRNESRLCGTQGMTNFDVLLGFKLSEPSTKLALYLVTVAAVASAVALARWLVATRTGRILVAVRDNESRLRFAGYQPVAYKTLVFAIAGALGGLSGALCTAQDTMISPSSMEPKASVIAVVMVAMGGRGTIYGAIVGALLYKWLESELSTVIANHWLFVLGGIFIAVVLFLPDGLVGAWRAFGVRLARQRTPAAAGSGPTALPAKATP